MSRPGTQTPANNAATVATPQLAPPPGVALESVVCTDDLKRRPSRPPDHEAESRALLALTRHLADSPSTILQKLTEIALQVFRAGSAGVSLISEETGDFYWPSIAGAWTPHVGGGTPRRFGPCGTVLDRGSVQLFKRPERYFPYLTPVAPIVEGLHSPIYVNKEPVGTVWIISHDEARTFDSEDARLLANLCAFASAAHQTLQSLNDLKREREHLRQSDGQFRAFVTASSDAVYSMSPDWSEMRHLRGREFIADTPEPNRTWLEKYIYPADQPRVSAAIKRAIASQSTFELEHRVIRADGTVGWTFSRAVPILNDQGESVEWFGAASDITDRKNAEQALRESEERFAFVRGTSGVGFWYCDLPFDVLEWDDRVKAHFHLPPDTRVTIETFYDRIHPDDREPTRLAIERSIAHHEPYDVDYRTIDPDTKALKWIRAIGRTFYADDGTPSRFDGVTIDITAHKRAEEALGLSEARRRLALQSAGLGAWHVDPATMSLTTDARFREIFGISADQIDYETAVAAIHPDDRLRVLEAVAAATRPDNPVPYAVEYRVVRPDGNVSWVFAQGRANVGSELLPGGPSIVSFDGTIAEITERKRAEEAVRSSRERYLALTTASSDIVYGMSADWSMLLPLDGRGLVASNSEPIQDWLSKNIPAEEHARIREATARAIEGKTLFELEHRVIRSDGSTGWTRSRAVPILDEAGNIVEWFGAASDITDRKRDEQALNASRERYRALFESIDEGFCIIEFIDGPHGPLSDYVHIEANPAYLTNTGIPHIVGQRVRDMVPNEAEGWIQIYRDVLVTGNSIRFERELVATGRHLELAAFRAGPPERRQVAVLFKDITERRRAEEALQASEQRFKIMANTAPAMLWITEPDAMCSFLSRGWYEYTGQSEEEALGVGWLRAVHPNDRDEATRIFRAANAKQQPFDLSHRLRRADGEYRWVLDSGRPRFDSSGHFSGYIGSVVDVHERTLAEQELARHRDQLEATVRERTTELEESHRQLRVSERMAALGTLSAGLGHDMGNLLLPIRVRLESLAEANLPEPQRRDVEAIRSSAEYLRKLSAGLRQLALDPHKSPGTDATELHHWWDEAEAMLRNTLPRGVALESRIAPQETWARISRPALTQAVFNLVQNAGDSMRERGGSVTVWTERSKDAIRVGVTDNGPGMSAEVKARCMEPFFTTKARGISTGMGLSLVYGLVADAGGNVQIESEPGRGTTFILSLRETSAPNKTSDIKPSTKTASVEIRNPRMHALVAGELRSLSIEVIPPDDTRTPDMLVLDDISNLKKSRDPSSVVLLAASAPDRPGILAIGERPSLTILRQALTKTAHIRAGAQ